MRLGVLTDLAGPAADLEIAGLAIDSRAVEPGFVFGAFPGAKVDGAAFIPQAVANGAVAVVARPDAAVPHTVVHLAADDPRLLMAHVAARFFAPAPATLLAVTGTNGKTSVAHMCFQLGLRLGVPAASLGTLGLLTSAGRSDTGMTTPDVLSFHRTLGQLAQDGVQLCAFEASSHALDQARVDGVRLSAAGFTNLTRDHLDYHGTMEAYEVAKALLFSRVLGPDGVAVINVDDPAGARIAAGCAARGQRVLSVGQTGTGIHLLAREPLLAGQRLRLSCAGRIFDLVLPLVGAFQADNLLVAAGLLIAAGHAPEAVFAAAERLEGVPGRLELAATTPTGAAAYVDYAHTPDGLRAALSALRPHTRHRLWVVFGCGGDRDRGKRPQMGTIAATLADHTIITDDNPRTEDPAAIRAEVAAGAPAATVIGDRHAAISAALEAAAAGDVVLIAGKGHEEGQIVGTRVIPFNDVAVARSIAEGLAA
jgi:UDP-N-acetylmuramoyl-L-alanyl-D-glutamate--2,6-diaminopimelate ligase